MESTFEDTKTIWKMVIANFTIHTTLNRGNLHMGTGELAFSTL